MRPELVDVPRPEGDGSRTIANILTAVQRRAAIGHALRSAAAATASGAVIWLLVPRPGRLAAALVTALLAGGAIWWRTRSSRTAAGAARLVERASPECRNVVITAAELLAHPERATPRMRARVFHDAAARAASVPRGRIAAIGRDAAMLAAAVAVAVLASGRVPVARLDRAAVGSARASATTASAAVTIEARVQPPAYTGQPPRDLANPDRIDAVEGSTLRLSVRGGSGAWRIRFESASLDVTRQGSESTVRTTLAESGYLAIEPLQPAEPGATRKLIAVAVSPDRAPVIRIERPGRDLVFPDTRATVPVAAAAVDDFGLQSFELRYTKVSGSGEQFEFQEGSLPIDLARESDRSWTARADIALARLALQPGDALVYRAVARDRRPGEAGLATSDTYFIEIAAPGQVALEGFALPPDRERYALSQQMILLKLQRLHAREPGLARPALEEETGNIAAEQRAVRANFIFLMGGTVEDEEVEAANSHEIQEGRLENTARKEISVAIQFMTRVEQALAAASTTQALPPAKAAVDALQRAFGRNRYFLKMLATRSRIDPSRRLSGELSAAADWRRELQPAAPDRETREARLLLSQLLDLAAALDAGRALDPRAVAALAEQALAIDPAADDWQQTSRRLSALRDAAAARRPRPDMLRIIDETLPAVLRRAQKDARPGAAPGVAAPGALLGAWAAKEKRP